MLQLGKKQLLKIVKKVDFGVYLGEKMDAGRKGAGTFAPKAGSKGNGTGGMNWRFFSTGIPGTG